MRITAAVKKLLPILVLISLAACIGNAGINQEVDQGSPALEKVELLETNDPVIDGVIDDQEWQKAEVGYFSDGSEVYLMILGDHLFLAIRAEGKGMIAGNVFLKQGDRITVLHTSAALGTAAYQEEGKAYRKIKDFEWCCRSRIDDEVSLAAREMFYSEEGWLGINSFLGTENELEYKVTILDHPEKLAVNFIYADGGEEKQLWPTYLEDGVAFPSSEGFPDLMEFSVEDWISLEDLE